MKHLKRLLMTPFQAPIPKWLLSLLIAIGLIGFADAAFLTIEHYMNAIPPCYVGGCEAVLTSAYATILGIPVALMGAVYYLAILILLFAHFDARKEVFFNLAVFLSFIGFLMSIYFFILQAAVIHSYCQYCIISGLTTTILFVALFRTFVRHRHKV